MNRFDLCIIESSDKAEYLQAYAFILDMEDYPDLHVEIWNFEHLDGATVDYINASCLRNGKQRRNPRIPTTPSPLSEGITLMLSEYSTLI